MRLRSQTEGGIIAYRGKKNTPLIDLSKQRHYDPALYWDAIQEQPSGRLILDPGEFYILGSRESLRVPAQYAAEMIAFNPRMGEFRVHYAGFFDPGFGIREPRRHARGPGSPVARDRHGSGSRPIDRNHPLRPDERRTDQHIRNRHRLVLRTPGPDAGEAVSGADHMPTLR